MHNWVAPKGRSGGFQRPRFFEYVAGHGNSRVRLIACPPGRCQGRASHICVLPEVAVSGFGVLCVQCRRAPQLDGPWVTLAFTPAAYLGCYSASGAEVGLRAARQTVQVPPAVPMDVMPVLPLAG